MGKIILVIGNGFDLNLGLNTSYNHFINNDLFLNKTVLMTFFYINFLNLYFQDNCFLI